MNRLFLFCVGGTGSRVLKSLLMLLASGVEINAHEIIPIIIDPDQDNGDVERTIRLLNFYQSVQNSTASDKSHFFKSKIRSLGTLREAGAVGNPFKMNITGLGDSHGKTFRDFIQYNSLEPATKSFLQLFYHEEKNLNSDLTVGFKGNPHMGSIVLNTLTDSADFNQLVSTITADDRIFIVSSIFGGTGAAGFPLLVKNIRQPDEKFIGKKAVLEQIPLGALSVLPYFGVARNDASAINKDTFIAKTKSALAYYNNSLQDVDAMYYIGDQISKDFDNHEGQAAQKNDAHFVEVAGALAIVDFMSLAKENIKIAPKFKEFGINEIASNADVSFPVLGAKSKQAVAKHLIQLFYSIYHIENRLEYNMKDSNCPHTKGNPSVGSAKLETSLLNSDFYQNNFSYFTQAFKEWLRELQRNNFSPFNFETTELQHLVQNIQQEKKGLLFKSDKWGFDEFNDALNEAEKQMGGLTAAQKLLALYSIATEILYKDRMQVALS